MLEAEHGEKQIMLTWATFLGAHQNQAVKQV